MKHAILILFSAVALCCGQGTFTVRFEEPPVVDPGFYRLVRHYYEAGMWFRQDTNFFVNMQLTRQGGNQTIPDNGTTYLRPQAGSPLLFSLSSDAVFDLMSVDLSKQNASIPDPSIGYFIGYLPDGSTVSTNFSVSGLTFQTFQFGPEFSGLSRVEIPAVVPVTYWALDNVVFTVIPEPCIGVFLGLGGLFFVSNWIRKRGSKP